MQLDIDGALSLGSSPVTEQVERPGLDFAFATATGSRWRFSSRYLNFVGILKR